jgi:hypothetical protein
VGAFVKLVRTVKPETPTPFSHSLFHRRAALRRVHADGGRDRARLLADDGSDRDQQPLEQVALNNARRALLQRLSQ